MLAFYEHVRLVMGAVSIFLCTLGGARSMGGKQDRVRSVIGSSGLVVGFCVVRSDLNQSDLAAEIGSINIDRAPPRVHKKIDTAPIARRTRSQTANVASAITPAQAAQRRYPAKFLQS